MSASGFAYIDIAIVLIVLISALMSIKKGFIREALSLLTWFAAFAIAISFHPLLSPLFEQYIAVPSLRNIAAMLVLFVLTLILGSVFSFALGGLIKATGLTSTDRLLGVFFGALRGVVIVALVVVFLKGIFSEDSWWQASQLLEYFDKLGVWLKSMGHTWFEFIQQKFFNEAI